MKNIISFYIIMCCLTWNIVVQAAETQTTRIISGSNVRVRREPNLSAPEVDRLKLGTIVWELAKTDQQQTIGQMQAYWYHIVLPNGQKGWVFGSLTLPFEKERRDEIYQQIVRARSTKKKLSFSDQIDFFHFLSRAIEEVQENEITAELKLARFVILRRSLLEHWDKSNFEGWVKEQQQYVYHNEPQGWLVKPDIFWNLHEEYRVLLIADDIAWEATNNPLGGECEGYLPCHLSRLTQTHGRYLTLYPDGKYTTKALGFTAEYLKHFTHEKHHTYDRSDYLILQQELKQLRTVVEDASAANKNIVLQQLDQIEKLHLQQQ